MNKKTKNDKLLKDYEKVSKSLTNKDKKNVTKKINDILDDLLEQSKPVK